MRMTSKSPPEAQYALRLRKALQNYYDYGVVDIKIAGSPYQESGLPDLICCIRGYFVGLEIKRSDHLATKKQMAQLNRIDVAGGYSTVVMTHIEPMYVVMRIDQWIKSKEAGKRRWEIKPSGETT